MMVYTKYKNRVGAIAWAVRARIAQPRDPVTLHNESLVFSFIRGNSP